VPFFAAFRSAKKSAIFLEKNREKQARPKRPGATIKYLQRTTSAAAGNGLGNTIKYLQRTTSGAAGNDRAQRSSTCDAQRAPPRATA
jgi:hypothetical protein